MSESKGPLMPTPEIDIGELRKLEAAATPGPWHTLQNHTRVYGGAENKTMVITGGWSVAWKHDDGVGDSKFITALRNAAPSLLAAAEECESLKYDNANLRTSNELLTDLEIDLRAEIAALQSRLALAERVVEAARELHGGLGPIAPVNLHNAIRAYDAEVESR